jgi:hypothetical protein
LLLFSPHFSARLIIARWEHRNLSTRTSKFAPVQQTFWAKETLVKSLLISTLDKVIYYIGTIFLQSTKPLFTSQNRVETSWKKFAIFFSMRVLDLDFYGWEPYLQFALSCLA